MPQRLMRPRDDGARFRHRRAGGDTVWRSLKAVAATAVLLAIAPVALAVGDLGLVAPFQGVWIGSSVVVDRHRTGPSMTASDISVTIRATDSGFEMTWKALHEDGAEWMTSRFVAAADPGTFELAGVDPPLHGNETLWAEIGDDELVVHLVSAGDDRAERVSRYRRSASDNRMTFDYTRMRDGAVLDRLTGILVKAKVVL